MRRPTRTTPHRSHWSRFNWSRFDWGRLGWALLLFALSQAVRTQTIGEHYPAGTPNAEAIIAQVWFVNHLRAVRKYAIVHQGDLYPYLVYRSKRGKYRFRTLERFLKNDFPAESGILAKDIAIFYYPMAVRGTGFLITDFTDSDRSQILQVWLPALRKVRRFPQPNHDDAYAGSDWTFGDVSLRKPRHETHRLLRVEPFAEAEGGGGILHTITIPEAQRRHPFTAYVPESSDEFKDRLCYVVESTTKFPDFWYDHRVSWIDRETFADYRTLYYRGGELIKIVDRHWRRMRNHPGGPDIEDPRGLYWTMWYGKNLRSGHETMAVIPPRASIWNQDIPDSTWTEANLRKLRR